MKYLPRETARAKLHALAAGRDEMPPSMLRAIGLG